MKLIRHIKTLWDDGTRVITNQEGFMRYEEEIRERSNNIWNDPNPTTISFEEWDYVDYDWDKEYLKIVKKKNHETVYRIQYE